MSRENVEIVRRAIDAFARGDLDAALYDNDPEVELDWSRSRGVAVGVYRGYEAVRDFWNSWLEAFDRIIVSVDEYIESGEDVVVPNRTCFWGREGIEVEARSAAVVTLRDRRIVRWRMYQDREEALKAVGLEK